MIVVKFHVQYTDYRFCKVSLERGDTQLNVVNHSISDFTTHLNLQVNDKL